MPSEHKKLRWRRKNAESEPEETDAIPGSTISTKKEMRTLAEEFENIEPLQPGKIPPVIAFVSQI
jgi:hypothetical protein